MTSNIKVEDSYIANILEQGAWGDDDEVGSRLIGSTAGCHSVASSYYVSRFLFLQKKQVTEDLNEFVCSKLIK